MILLIDNYDSFTFNLQRYLVRLGQDVVVLRNDSAALDAALQNCSAIVLSPGPKAPNEAGRCLEIVREYSGATAILGICLGHQVIFQAFGGTITRAQRPIHGRDLPIELESHKLFEKIPSRSRFARYHSLIGDAASVPACLKTIAWSSGLGNSSDSAQEIMAIAHRHHATFGVQFHPESILSGHGYQLLANFLKLAGLTIVEPLPTSDLVVSAEQIGAEGPANELPEGTDELTVVLPRLLQPNP
jgi:para-aminobenzoate synthetase component II